MPYSLMIPPSKVNVQNQYCFFTFCGGLLSVLTNRALSAAFDIIFCFFSSVLENIVIK